MSAGRTKLSAQRVCAPIGLQSDQWTQELRLSSRDPDATFKWVGGLYYENAKQHDSQYAFNNDIAQLLHTYYGNRWPQRCRIRLDLRWWTASGYTPATLTSRISRPRIRRSTTRATENSGSRQDCVRNTETAFASPVMALQRRGALLSGISKREPRQSRVSVSWQQNEDVCTTYRRPRGFVRVDQIPCHPLTPTCVLRPYELSPVERPNPATTILTRCEL